MSTDTPTRVSRRSRPAAAVALALAAVVTIGCRQDMHDQPRFEPLEVNPFFDDNMASRAPVEGTVARGHLREDVGFYTGTGEDGVLLAQLPMEPDVELLRRGRERYDIFCAPCHGATGAGDGMVVQRGFKQPPSLHQDRLRDQPVGYYVDAVTNGFGVMSSYASQVTPEERWAIAAYIKVLQYSQRAHLAELPEVDRDAVNDLGQPKATETGSGH